MATYEDIAKSLGVSKAAVSLAMRNKPGVSEALRIRIVERVKDIGYRPNPLVAVHMAHLRGTKSVRYEGKIAFLSSSGDEAKTAADSRDSKYLEGVKKAAELAGFGVEVFSLVEPKLSLARIRQMIWARGIPGIIIGPLPKPGMLDLDVSAFATVALGFTLQPQYLHCVRPNLYDMMISTLQILSARGYEKPGFAQLFDEDQWLLHLGSAGYHVWKTSYRNSSKALPPIVLLKRNDNAAFLKWYERYKPDVIISQNTQFAVWLKEAGIRIPKDVSYAALSVAGDEYSGFPPDLETIGREAVHLLVSQIYSNERGAPVQPRLLLVPSHWHEGSTLRAIPKQRRK